MRAIVIALLGFGLMGPVAPGLSGPVQAQSSASPPGAAPPGAALPGAAMQELIEASKATAKAARENVDYARVTPDLLSQILAKLDKIEDKLDKVETAIKREGAAKGPGRR